MATAKKLPSGSWRVRVVDHSKNPAFVVNDQREKLA